MRKIVKLYREFNKKVKGDMTGEQACKALKIDIRKVFPYMSPHSGVDMFYLYLLKHL